MANGLALELNRMRRANRKTKNSVKKRIENLLQNSFSATEMPKL